MRPLTPEERAKVVEWFDATKSPTIVRQRFRKWFHRHPPSISSIYKWVKHASEENCVSSAASGAKKTEVLRGELANAVVGVFESDPTMSVKKAAKLFSVSEESVREIRRRARRLDMEAQDGSKTDESCIPKVVIKVPNKKMTCSYCNFTSRYHSTMTAHERQHEKVLERQHRLRAMQVFECSVCPAKFGLDSDLQRHLRTHAKPEDTDDTLCVRVVCPTSSCEKGGLVVRVPIKERPFACHLCTESFFARRTLKAHLNTHTEKNPYECELCPATFSKQCSLKAHVLSHGREHTCAICSESFGHKSSLDMHLQTHTDVMPFKCRHCSRLFMQKAAFTRHVRAKHKYDGKRKTKWHVRSKPVVRSLADEIREANAEPPDPAGAGNAEPVSAEEAAQYRMLIRQRCSTWMKQLHKLACDSVEVTQVESGTTGPAKVENTRSTMTDPAAVVCAASTAVDLPALIKTEPGVADSAKVVHIEIAEGGNMESAMTGAASVASMGSVMGDPAKVVKTEPGVADSAEVVRIKSGMIDLAEVGNAGSPVTVEAAGKRPAETGSTEAAKMRSCMTVSAEEGDTGSGDSAQVIDTESAAADC